MMISIKALNILPETYAQPTTLHETFEIHARTYPNATALIWENDLITYSELNSAASHAAAELMTLGVSLNTYVPILLRRCPQLIISLLAVLKAGAAYALLDENWPENRLKDIICLLKPPLLITDQKIPFLEETPIWNPFSPRSVLKEHPPFPTVSPEAPCSIFFTSGTTGKPKGVVSPHSGTARLFKDKSFAKFSSKTAIPLAAALPWDAFSLELWGSLLNGGISWIIDEPYLSNHMLRKATHDHGMNTVWMTSSLFNMVLEEDIEAFSGLQQVLIGGEKLSVPHVEKFLRHHPSIALINGYGPVESTIFATTHLITLQDCESSDGIPIGTPVPKTQIHVLDKQDRLCQEDEIGEICISGEGLALGYLHDWALTEKKFTQIQLKDTYTRIYRTGDLGFWKNGLLYFKGREDRQVKIRGHRVELSEVESQIQNLLPEIKSCRVIARRDESNASQELIAFCILKKEGTCLKNAHEFLKSKLTPYQTPSILIAVDSFPLTPQGKLDEQTLLNMALDSSNEPITSFSAISSPTTPLENIVATVFTDVLGKGPIPSEIPFKELGITSLDMGRICARLGSLLHQTIPLSSLYKHPTIASFSKYLAQINSPVQPFSNKNGSGQITSMQMMYLMQHLVNPQDLTPYCLLTWLIKGELDSQKLEKAIEYVHLQHASLRSKYVFDPVPGIESFKDSLPSLTLLPKQNSIDKAIKFLRLELSQKLDPLEGIIWRTAIIQVAETDTSVFGCVIHHIAFDGYSEHLLSGALSRSYNAISEENSTPQTSSEAYIPEFMRTEHTKAFIENLIDTPAINWPVENPPGDCHGASIDEHSVLLDNLLIKKIDDFSKKNFLSRFDILFHYWTRSLIKITGQRDFGIGIPVRQRVTSGSENEIGCHINMLCIRVKDNLFDDSSEGLQKTSHLIRTAFEHQDIPFIEILQSVKPPQKSRAPLFQTLFALQDNPLPELYLDGLETTFIRQPYLDIPLELHAEIWPDSTGGLRLSISYRHKQVSITIVENLVKNFLLELNNFAKA
jgi:amino acid adenylation domain-containing protein